MCRRKRSGGKVGEEKVERVLIGAEKIMCLM